MSGRNRPVVKPFKIDTKNECLETSLYKPSKSISNLNGSAKVWNWLYISMKMGVRDFPRTSKYWKSIPKMKAWRHILLTLQNRYQKWMLGDTYFWCFKNESNLNNLANLGIPRNDFQSIFPLKHNWIIHMNLHNLSNSTVQEWTQNVD